MIRTGRSTERIPDTATDAATGQFAADVQYYLMRDPRQLPSRYFYDGLGSALFDAICLLPWYGLTRAELRLLRAHGASVFRRLDGVTAVAELGPGSGDKLVALLDAAADGRPSLDVHLIDVSRRALEASTRLVQTLDGVHVVAHQASYETGLVEALRGVAHRGRTLVLFLGSNIGNFDPPGALALLHNIRASLMDGDALLLGTDLIKPEAALRLAYDDPLGVTAAFNRNLLVRINRELDGNFDLDRFDHRVVWNDHHSRIEMQLVARRSQRIVIPRAELDFTITENEAIWTESSYKYCDADVVALLKATGFQPACHWTDEPDQFMLTLAEAV